MRKSAIVLALVLGTQSLMAEEIAFERPSVFGKKQVVTYNQGFKLLPNEEDNFFQKKTTQIFPKECKANKDTVTIKGQVFFCKPLPVKDVTEIKSIVAKKSVEQPQDLVTISKQLNNEETPNSGGVGGALNSIIMVIDKLIAIGQKIMPTIEKGRPVVSNNPMAAVSVLPRTDQKDFVVHEMGNWSIPKTAIFKVSYVNGLNSKVVEFNYAVTFQFNGTHKGKGKYLNGIRVSPKNINVSWGFDLDASSQLIAISNVGTEENVVAGATLEIVYTVKNWTKNITTADSFFVDGRGQIYRL